MDQNRYRTKSNRTETTQHVSVSVLPTAEWVALRGNGPAGCRPVLTAKSWMKGGGDRGGLSCETPVMRSSPESAAGSGSNGRSSEFQVETR